MSKDITLIQNKDSKSSSASQMYDLAIELGLMTTDVASTFSHLMPYSAPAKLFLSGLKAVRLQSQAIDILKDEQSLFSKKRITLEDLSSNYNKDMLDAILGLEANKTTEEIKFSYLKKVILVGLTKDEKGRIKAKHFFNTIAELTSTEILIIASCYHFSTANQKWKADKPNASNHHNWRQSIAVHSGLEFRDIIESTESNLERLKLILKDRLTTSLDLGENYRLTDYGFGLCKFTSEYDEIMS